MRVGRRLLARRFQSDAELPPPPGSEETIDNRIIPLDMYPGLSAEPFSKEIAEVLLADIALRDVEIRPEGILYLPEIKCASSNPLPC